MNQTKEKNEKDADEEKDLHESDSPENVPDEIEDAVQLDGPAEEEYSEPNSPSPAEDNDPPPENVTYEGVEVEEQKSGEEDDVQYTNLDELLAVWWEYKRTQKFKKKKKEIIEIFTDENYWADGRYTDDEDFNYLQA